MNVSRMFAGELWGKIHHDSRTVTENQVNCLKNAITLKLAPPVVDMVIKIDEITSS